MALPFEPESYQSARSRFNSALAHVYFDEPTDAVQADDMRRHVFDFDDGLRIFACRFRPANGRPAIFLTFQAMRGSKSERAFTEIVLTTLLTDETRRRRTIWLRQRVQRLTLDPDMLRPLRLTIAGNTLRAVECAPVEEAAERRNGSGSEVGV